MTTRAIELIILIVLSTWLGLYLLVRGYGGHVEKLTGATLLSYGAYLFLRALAATTQGIFLARLAYIPGVVALVFLCHLSWSFGSARPAFKRIASLAVVVASFAVGGLAVCTSFILQRIPSSPPYAWPRLEAGPAMWAWLVYLCLLIGTSLYHFGRALLNKSRQVREPRRKAAGASLLMIAAGFGYHIGALYEDGLAIVSVILFAIGGLSLAYILVATFDQAYRGPAGERGVSSSILWNTLIVLFGTPLLIITIGLLTTEAPSLATLFMIAFWAAALAAMMAGMQHRLYARFRREIRCQSRRTWQSVPALTFSLAAPSAAPAMVSADHAPRTPENRVMNGQLTCKSDAGSQVDEQIAAVVEDADQQLYRDLRLALRNLKDPARLGSLKTLTCDLPGETCWERGQALQQQLTQALQRLEPHAGGEPYEHQWQHYQILWRLYVQGQSRAQIMQSLSLSERHYQRHLHDALVVFVAKWQNCGKICVDND
jgi:hypothetical protein